MISLSVFLISVLVGGLFALYFLRDTFAALSRVAAEHAKTYSLAYAKGAALIMIAMISAFDENFRTLTREAASGFPWWNWAILFLKPILAGLSVFAAFIDRSVQSAKDAKQGTTTTTTTASTSSSTAAPFPKTP
jgi:hypothetical protein